MLLRHRTTLPNRTGFFIGLWLAVAAALAGCPSTTQPSDCVPTTCVAAGKNCGEISDGCGGTLACGSCTTPDTCGGAGVGNVCGAPPAPTPLNIKRPDAFAVGEVLLVSDADWHVVLPLVPVAVWQATTDVEYADCPHPYGGAGRACAIPVLVFHQETSASYAASSMLPSVTSDLDATVNFLDRYTPSQVTYQGSLPADAAALLSSKYNLAAAPALTSYWSSWDTVIYVVDDYPLALVASELASVLNAPLLIQGVNDALDLGGKNIVCVGHDDPALCNVAYASPLEVESRIVELTSSDKLLLAAPSDLATPPVTSTWPLTFEQTQGALGTLFSGYSLAAPFLAAAKLEVLLPYTDRDHSYGAVEAFLASAIASIPVSNPAYLTIVASPADIPASRNDYCAFDRYEPGCTSYTWTQVDGAIYGDLDGDYVQDLAVGRLGGFSVSDVSAYIARDLFYDRLPPATGSLTLQALLNYPGNAADTVQFVDHAAGLVGLVSTNLSAEYGVKFPPESFAGQRLIYYVGHGDKVGGLNGFDSTSLRRAQVALQSSLVAVSACSTCAFDTTAPELRSLLFCDDVLRRGALGYVGAVDEDSSPNVVPMDWLRYLAKGEDLGTAFKHASNLAIANPISAFSPYNTLLGDPTFAPGLVPTGDVDLAHVTVSAPSPLPDGSVTQSVTIVLDPITTRRYEGVYEAGPLNFISVAGPSFAGDSIERSGVGYLKYDLDPHTSVEMSNQTLNVAVAVAKVGRGVFIDTVHAERVVGSQVIDMTGSVTPQHVLDVGDSSYFYIAIQELGLPGVPLVPAQTPYTTPPVTLTVVLHFAAPTGL